MASGAVPDINTEFVSLSMSPCNLCPRNCGALRREGGRGVCGAGDEALVARAALHYWEEPPISGTRGSGTVFFTHCPLRCVYCQNAELAAGEAGWEVSVERLAQICLDLQAQGALNINFVTPTHYTLHAIEAVKLARKQGLELPIVWNTSGYERSQVIYELKGTVDVFLADFKYADANLAKRYSNAPDYPEVAMKAIEAMVEVTGEPRYDEYRGMPRMACGVIVRHMLLPSAIDQSKRAIELLWNKFANKVAYSIMNQYTPVMREEQLARYPELAASPYLDEYEELLDFADSLGMVDYFWQDGPAATESFIPSWNGEGVLRGADSE